jgi:hypothetical protein
MGKRAKFIIPLLLLLGLRLAFGLWAPPVQPVTDEIQTFLLGLKFYTTGAWPYYGNDVITPPDNLVLQTQDPGPLEGLLVGGPMVLWHSPMASFLFLNLFTLTGFTFLAWYSHKRLPRFSLWFILAWALTAPWSIHYSTGMINMSYTIGLACLFFPALLESIPSLNVGCFSRSLANALMGLTLAGWMQLHRTFVLILPMVLVSFYFQWKETRKADGPLYFLAGGLPFWALVVPTLLRPDYHLFRDVTGFSPGLNLQHVRAFFTILVQFFALGSFEMPRFIGMHTAERAQYLASDLYLMPGFFLWYFGFLQVLILVGYLFVSKDSRTDWQPVRFLTILAFLTVFGTLLFTVKNPDVNTFCEMLPLVLLYSFYVWDKWWANRWGRRTLWFFLACVLVFQTAFIFSQRPLNKSFYLMDQAAMTQAIDTKNYHLLGERRPGALY